MAAKKKDDEKPGERTTEPLTSQDDAQDAVDAGRAAVGDATATGQERIRRLGAEDERLAEVSGGSDLPIAGEPEPDFLAQSVKASGAQTEEALFVGNGTIPVGVAPSNSGLVPISAVENDPDKAQERIDKQREDLKRATAGIGHRRRELTEAEVSRMGGAELRAVAHDRGYDIQDTLGARGVREAFLREQSSDKNLSK